MSLCRWLRGLAKITRRYQLQTAAHNLRLILRQLVESPNCGLRGVSENHRAGSLPPSLTAGLHRMQATHALEIATTARNGSHVSRQNKISLKNNFQRKCPRDSW